MKRILLAVIFAAFAGLAQGQTKGTNVLTFGVSTNESKTETFGNTQTSKSSHYTLGYGLFVVENGKITIGATISNQGVTNSTGYSSEIDGVGGSVGYQHYYPLIKKLFAYAGGYVSYGHSESDNTPDKSTNNNYGVGVSGGVAWFPFKHFAFEMNVANVEAYYAKSKNVSGSVTNTTKAFNIVTGGTLTNLGFTVNFLF